MYPNTRNVVIAGVSHFEDPRIVDLVDALIRSGRNVVASALNLDSEGKPYGLLPQLMTLADRLHLKKAVCLDGGCGADAIRSKSVESGFEPVCVHHYHFPGSPPIRQVDSGFLSLWLGPMFSSKSTDVYEEIKRMDRAGVRHVEFKWLKDDVGEEELKQKPFDQGFIELKGGTKIPAILVRDAKDIRQYLRDHGDIKRVIIDELQFIGGVYDLVYDLMPRGYGFLGTGLPRTFRRDGFGEVPQLMCLADEVHMQHAYCVVCKHPCTDNQRMKWEREILVPVHKDDPTVAPGAGASENEGAGKDYHYEPRCLVHWTLPGENALAYDFPYLYRV